jgi:hypothetical protein
MQGQPDPDDISGLLGVIEMKGLGLSRDGGREDFLKTSAPHSLMTTYRKKLLSTRSISLDSNF